jgi:hypothetical protein
MRDSFGPKSVLRVKRFSCLWNKGSQSWPSSWLFGRPRTFNASEEKVSAEKEQSEGSYMKGGTLTEGKPGKKQ